MEYYDVDEVTCVFAKNGAMIQFWGRADKDDCLEKFTMVYPDMRSAFDIVESLYEQKNRRKKLVDTD